MRGKSGSIQEFGTLYSVDTLFIIFVIYLTFEIVDILKWTYYCLVICKDQAYVKAVQVLHLMEFKRV